MRKNISLICILTATALLGAVQTMADPPAGLSIENYVLIAKERVTRTAYQYTFTADAVNQTDRDFYMLGAQLSSTSPNTTVVDGTLAFGDVMQGETATSSDTFVIVQERGGNFDPSALNWEFQWEDRIWNAPAPAGLTANPPGWGLTVTSDIEPGVPYYYVRNNVAAAIISNRQSANNGSGTLQLGFAADVVNRAVNMDTLDWTQFIMSTTMYTNDTWNVPDHNLTLPNISVESDRVVAAGHWIYNPDIEASVDYKMLPNAPIMKIVVNLTNTMTTDFTGYIEYMLDPDGSGNQNAYAPGLGWGVGYRTSGWSANYVYDGPNTPGTLPGHAIAWCESNPSAVLPQGYIVGVWFDASMPAGGSKRIVMYHITDWVADETEPYAYCADWAAQIPILDDEITTMGVVTGTVTNGATGAPMSGVNVVAKNTLGAVVSSMGTNSSGQYSMMLPTDVYTLTATELFSESDSRSVNMNVGSSPFVVNFELDPIVAWAGAGKILNGSLVEGTENDVTMINQLLAMTIADTFDDPQLAGSTKGKPINMAIKGQPDGIDWLNLPYISLTKPAGTEAWAVTTVQNDTVEVVSLEPERAIVRTTGVYSEVAGVTLETLYTINADQTWVEAKTTITNDSGSDQTLWIGDVIDNDESGQTSYVPGPGLITAPYSSPAEYEPAVPWVAQFGDSAQCYGFIYLGQVEGMLAYGNTNWIQSQLHVTIPAGGSYVLERYAVVASTAGYAEKYEAIAEIYNTHLAGFTGEFHLDHDVINAGETVNAVVLVTNLGEEELTDCTAELVITTALTTSDPLQQAFPPIPAGQSSALTWTLTGVSGGRTPVRVEVSSQSAFFTATKSVFVNGPGWYAGDNHTHSVYSDGTGTIAQNYQSAISKGLTFVTSTDHNSIAQGPDVYANSTDTFLGLLGDEITRDYGHSLGYHIDHLIPNLPAQESIYDTISCYGGTGLFYIAHPFYPGLEWDYPDVVDYTGIEVWNGFYAPTHEVNTRAFAWWDQRNLDGMHLYGIANSDAHNVNKIGDPHIRAWLNSFTREEIIRALGTGTFYGTDGPELNFEINGVMMGGDVQIVARNEVVNIVLTAAHVNPIDTVTLIKNGATLQTWTPGTNQMATSVQDTARAGDFYRLVVQTTDGKYAFSNPIWIAQ